MKKAIREVWIYKIDTDDGKEDWVMLEKKGPWSKIFVLASPSNVARRLHELQKQLTIFEIAGIHFDPPWPRELTQTGMHPCRLLNEQEITELTNEYGKMRSSH